jgi:uncharacterized membrane protein YesL
MEWYYAVGDKQMGPVNDEEFKRLAAEGTIRPDTLVWRAGMGNWKPYREVTAGSAEGGTPALSLASVPAEAAGATGSPGSGSVVCRECGKIFPPDEVAKFGDAFVCATCKPIYVQRMREGVGGSGSGGTVTEDELLNRDYEVDVGESISQGWEAFKRNAGLLIGGTVVAYLVLIACNLIPFLSLILPWIISGPIMGGLWMLYINNIRGDEAKFADAFSGFGPRFTSLFATYVVSSILTGVCLIPLGIVAAIFILIPMQTSGRAAAPNIGAGAILAMVITGLPAFLAIIYLSIAWFFALPLVADKGLGFWSAMNLSRRVVNKHFWSTLLLLFVCWLLMVVSMLACGVGVLLGGPVVAGAVSWHYQRVFGDLAPETL